MARNNRSKKLAQRERRAMERRAGLPSNPSPPLSHSAAEYSERSFSLEWRYHLPPPGVLQGYNFIKNGPDRLLRLVERQAKHRQKVENRDSWTETFQRLWGTVSATLIGLAGLGGGVWLIDRDHSVTGLAALIGTLATLAAAVQNAKKPPPAAPKDDPEPMADPERQLELPIPHERE